MNERSFVDTGDNYSILNSLLGIARPGVSLYLSTMSTKHKKEAEDFRIVEVHHFTEGGLGVKVTFEQVKYFILLDRGNKKFKKLRFIKLLPQN